MTYRLYINNHTKPSMPIPIRHQESTITLQVIVGERIIEEIRTVTGIPSSGTRNDLVSVRMALELGCRIKPSECKQY